ncbi:OFA family MFS transporter [Sporolactobacillus sp. CPB3-1]|uniref:OFA family MFS transporter n=1 Tax=Sporolactobacillus mangiferae TaxID=2940498 RepID=A0ABT0MDE7_9BACL|nr:OFA family MFS transporter [Sporolactobacillus mangiferae]MCL1632901.1 OFA family MFS transporter [Sporolactobacillus mangiferae]
MKVNKRTKLHSTPLQVLIGTIIAMIALGTIYTWSLFNQPLADLYGWRVRAVATTFSIMSFALSFSTLLASSIQKKIGIRSLLILTGVGMGGGLIISSFASSLWMLYIFAGILVGASNGIAYMTTLSNAIQSFPEKKGLISGIAVGAYGTGSLLFKYILGFLMTHTGVMQTFLYWGMMIMLLMLVGALLIREAQVEAGEPRAFTRKTNRDYELKEMLHTKEAYLLFFILFTACMSGLYLIGSVANIGVGLAGLDLATAANAVAMVAIFNTIGRIVLGMISDHFNRLKVIAVSLLMTAVAALVLSHVQLTFLLYFLCVSSVAFCFGGNITIFPTVVAEYFGLKNQSRNYGIIYQGFGIGGLSISFISGALGGFGPTFRFIAVLCIVASIIALLLHVPGTKHVPLFSAHRVRERESH